VSSTTPADLARIKRERAVARVQRERAQGELLDDRLLFHDTIRQKLTGLCSLTQFYNFCRCGNEQIFRTCQCCGLIESFPYQCSIKWCPLCQWKIGKVREEVIAAWANQVAQPKHLVLTQRNFKTLTGSKIREHTRNLAKVRRSRAFKEVAGGCVTVEITNEENGWHLHSHWLLNCPWLDMERVSQAWGKLVGQEFAIVKVKDVREKEYLREISKYVAKPADLAGWKPEELNEFVHAVRGRRFFFSFGSLFHLGPEIRRALKANETESVSCDCGSWEFRYESELMATLHDAQRAWSALPRSKKKSRLQV
jgi:Replication protein